MLPSGIAMLLWQYRADHPALPATCVHVTPLSVDRHTSFFMPLVSAPPIRMMLPSGITTVLWYDRADHPALAFTCIHVAQLSVDRHTSFVIELPSANPRESDNFEGGSEVPRDAPTKPPITRILPSARTTPL
jgi:hypothetical protein